MVKALTLKESSDWLVAHGLPGDMREIRRMDGECFHLPDKASVLTALGLSVSELYEHQETLVILWEVGVWPYPEYLFKALEESFGCAGRQATGYLFCNPFSGELESMLALVLHNSWDVPLVGLQ